MVCNFQKPRFCVWNLPMIVVPEMNTNWYVGEREWRWDAHTFEPIAVLRAKHWDGSNFRSAATARMMSSDTLLTGLLSLPDANMCNVCAMILVH